MTGEEINGKFAVVADHLATFAMGMQSLQEEVRRLAAVQARTDDSARALLAAKFSTTLHNKACQTRPRPLSSLASPQ